jgi:hypothetical protein
MLGLLQLRAAQRLRSAQLWAKLQTIQWTMPQTMVPPCRSSRSSRRVLPARRRLLALPAQSLAVPR